MKINKTKVLIIIILGISILASQIIYIIIFHGGLSRKQSVWGDFGSFFGGFIGTILGFINLLFLIQTIGIQNDQLKLMKDDFQIQINAREKSESKERYYYYEKILLESISQINELKNYYATKDHSGENNFTLAVFGILNMYYGLIQQSEGKSYSPESRDEKILRKNIIRYIGIANIIIDATRTILNGDIIEDNKKKLIARYQILLTDSDIKYLVCYREFIENDDSEIKILNEVLKQYSKISINDLMNNRNMNIKEIAIENNIEQIKFKEIP